MTSHPESVDAVPELGLCEGMRIDVGDIQGCLFVGVLTRFRCDELTGCVEMTVQ
jgi:hypothetical protein